jgi:hypothetical protein
MPILLLGEDGRFLPVQALVEDAPDHGQAKNRLSRRARNSLG